MSEHPVLSPASIPVLVPIAQQLDARPISDRTDLIAHAGNRPDFRKENKMTTKGKILVLVSSGYGLPLKDGKVYAGAGYYLNELTVPTRALMEEGYEITLDRKSVV